KLVLPIITAVLTVSPSARGWIVLTRYQKGSDNACSASQARIPIFGLEVFSRNKYKYKITSRSPMSGTKATEPIHTRPCQSRWISEQGKRWIMQRAAFSLYCPERQTETL